MDADCLICFESHPTAECPDRKPQHCPNCHIHIRHQSDHSSVCCMKQWIFQPYKDFFAKPPLQRYIISCNFPFRFLSGGDWRKPFDGNQLVSPDYDTIIRFKNENDFSVLTGSFAPIRIAFVVKENSKFSVKLILLASRERFIVAKALDQPFDRNTAMNKYAWKTTLILAVPSNSDLCLNVMVTPPRKLVRCYDLKYDSSLKKFIIPEQLALDVITNKNVSHSI